MSEIQQGLLIAGIGMGLVFLLIILLWLLMDLMMRMTSNKKTIQAEVGEGDESAATAVPDIEDVEIKRRAVAAGVAVALAMSSDQQYKTTQMVKEEGSRISPWLSYHRARLLENKK